MTEESEVQALYSALFILKHSLRSLEVMSIANLSVTTPRAITTIVSAVSAVKTLRLLNIQNADAYRQWLLYLAASSPEPSGSSQRIVLPSITHHRGPATIPLPRLQILEVSTQCNQTSMSLKDGRLFIVVAEARAKMGMHLKKIVINRSLALTTKKKLSGHVDEMLDGRLLKMW